MIEKTELQGQFSLWMQAEIEKKSLMIVGKPPNPRYNSTAPTPTFFMTLQAAFATPSSLSEMHEIN